VLRIQDVYPSSRILIFPYPGCRIQKQQQKWWVKKSCCHTFLHSHIFLKIENDFSFEELKKKILCNFQRIFRIRNTAKCIKPLLLTYPGNPWPSA